MFPYIGGKAHHIKYLDPLFPLTFDTFVDVFGGAGWVTVKSQSIARASTRIYNDRNPYLANIFYWFKTDPHALRELLASYPQQDKLLYKQFQIEIFGPDPIQLDIEAAAKYLYLETQSFSGNTLGLNSSIYFNKLKTVNSVLRKLENPKIVKRLQTLTAVENLDCVEVIKKYDSPNTFFYVDPPYYNKEHYYTQAFDQAKHKELADCLNNIQGRFALSYYEFSELNDWFPQHKYRYNRYSISKQNSSNANKQRAVELVITN